MARISTYTVVSPVENRDMVIGTDVNDSNITKNFRVEDIAALAGPGGYVTLAHVLAAGNTATNDIILTGNISTTGNISLTGTLSANGGVGTAGQVLSSQGPGLPAQWIDHSTLGPNLSEVLAVGNTATNNIILNGNITQNTGDHLLSVGNMTVLTGYLSLGGVLKDGAASDGTAGQVLTSTGTATSWVDQSTIIGAPNTLTEVLTAGNSATDLDINLACTGKIVTIGTGASSFNGGIAVGKDFT